MSEKILACEKKIYKVTKNDLPLSCPMPNMKLWNAHPKIYLPIEKTGHAICEYCSAEFILTDFSSQSTMKNNIDVR